MFKHRTTRCEGDHVKVTIVADRAFGDKKLYDFLVGELGPYLPISSETRLPQSLDK